MANRKPAKAKETQAQKNARIERELRAAGKKFTPSATVKAQNKRIAQKQAKIAAQTPAPRRAAKPATGGTTRRSPIEYFSGKTFDKTMGRAMKKAGI